MNTAESTPGPETKLYLMVFGALLVIVALEVFLTYQHVATGMLIVALLTLAFLEATLGVMYFMHLKYEKRILFWSLIPYVLMCFILLNHIWRDAARVISHPVQSP
jgi:caa(3)-type oxidase subunit IV